MMLIMGCNVDDDDDEDDGCTSYLRFDLQPSSCRSWEGCISLPEQRSHSVRLCFWIEVLHGRLQNSN